MAVQVEHPSVRVRSDRQPSGKVSDAESEFGFEFRRTRPDRTTPDSGLSPRKDRTASSVLADAALNDWSSSSEEDENDVTAADESPVRTRSLHVVNKTPVKDTLDARVALGELNLNDDLSRDHRDGGASTRISINKTSPRKPQMLYRETTPAAVKLNASLQPRLVSQNVKLFIQTFEDKIIHNKTQANRRVSAEGGRRVSLGGSIVSENGSIRRWSRQAHDVSIPEIVSQRHDRTSD